MTISANVVLIAGQFIAELSDGREIRGHDCRELALSLCGAGVSGDALSYHWRTGLCMITAGRQAALCAEVRRLERLSDAEWRLERVVVTS